MNDFTCRGFEGKVTQVPDPDGWWHASVQVAEGVWIDGGGKTPSAAKARVRRKLDAVERAFRERRRG